jgi:NhaP-type Na+/H+ or K+/H+ antiporter
MDPNGENFEDIQTDPTTYLKVLGSFLYLSISSVSVGAGSGFIASLMTKHFRFISHSAIGESSLLISFAMIGYFISEIFNLSGIVSLLSTAIVMTHYTFFNLSPQGKNTTSILF